MPANPGAAANRRRIIFEQIRSRKYKEKDEVDDGARAVDPGRYGKLLCAMRDARDAHRRQHPTSLPEISFLGRVCRHNYRARMYTPGWGRFVQVDPTRYQGSGTNLYAYIGNDPLNLIDPFGLNDQPNPATFRDPLTGMTPAQGLQAGAQTLRLIGGLAEGMMCCLHMPGEAAGLRMIARGAAALEGLAALQALEESAPSLPAFIRGGPTSGILRVPTGDIPLQSGYAGPASSVPTGTSGFDIITRAHVEGHAAAVMQQQGISEAMLLHQQPGDL